MENNATAKHEASTFKLRCNLEEQPKTVENGKKTINFIIRPTKERNLCPIRPRTQFYTYETNVLKILQRIPKRLEILDYNTRTTFDNIPIAGKSASNNVINNREPISTGYLCYFWISSHFVQLEQEIMNKQINRNKEKLSRTKRGSGQCACVKAIYFVPVCISKYRMEHNKTSNIVFNFDPVFLPIIWRLLIQSGNL